MTETVYRWRKNVLLWIVAVHTMQGPFSAGTLLRFECPSGDTIMLQT